MSYNYVICFFCKQKTAYEMRISDWSSDVCSSDLKSTGSKVPLSLARKRNSSGATWRLMNKNLHYVAEHTSAASNQGRSIIPRARQPWPTRSHRSACMKSKNDGQDAVYPGRGRAWYSLTVLWLIFM